MRRQLESHKQKINMDQTVTTVNEEEEYVHTYIHTMMVLRIIVIKQLDRMESRNSEGFISNSQKKAEENRGEQRRTELVSSVSQ